MGLGAVLPEDILFWHRLRLLAMAWLPGICLLFSLTYARANYEDFLRRWRPVRYATMALPVATAVLFWGNLVTAYEPGPAPGKSFIDIGQAGWALHVLFIVGITLALMNAERTLRASAGVMRWRIKYMVLALAVILAVRIYSSAEALLYRCQLQEMEGLNAAALILGCLLMLVALFRTGRARLDLYLSHTVLAHSVTLLLAGGYLLTVGLIARVVVKLGPVGGFPVAAFMVLVGLLGLTILLASDRLRELTRRFVSRHLRRPHYDYRVVWSNFAGRTAAIVDRDEYCRMVTRIVAETLQALSVTLWTVDEARGRLRFGASTSLSGTEAKDLLEPGLDAADMIAAMRDRPAPVDLDESNEEWAEPLRQRYPDFFHKGSHRICLPLSAAGRLLGIMVLGDRVNGQPYSGEETSLLSAVGGQIGARLLNIELSGRLLEAKQMEAFQTMSTFFVHDLKNTTSTLSLMLQNLPKHFEDPAFRQDALRAIGNSVEKMNGLIRRLTMLRQKLDMAVSANNLNDVVESAIASAGFTGQARLAKRLGALAPTPLDPEQMQKVVTNLLLNAREASGPEGEIAVETAAQGGWVVLSVRDTGCGMNREFIEQHLFRPFRSTKKEGMGIGLYQSRMIVEAHRGRIEVESNEGKGSTFRVFLPAKGGTE
jgi:putative PEP-CTERM system histidine kinase